MGKPKIADKVCLICAICYQKDFDLDELYGRMTELFGPVDTRSAPFPFEHTKYYRKEMGDELFKLYCSFERLIDPMDIVDIKLATNQLEELYSRNGKRTVNIDPGYIETPKLVLATTKNFSHRIYLGKGIYGDVQLFWRGGQFQPNPWTYPDYLMPETIQYFTQVRARYLSRRGEE